MYLISSISNIDVRIEEVMKFYQTIAPAIFCVVYTSTLFGFENIKVAEDILDEIDQFRVNRSGYFDRVKDAKAQYGKEKPVLIKKVSIQEDTILYEDNHENRNDRVCLMILSSMQKIRLWSFLDDFAPRIDDRLCECKGENIFITCSSSKGRDHYVLETRKGEEIVSSQISIDRKTIATCNKEGVISKWELRVDENFSKMSEIYPDHMVKARKDRVEPIDCEE